MDASHDYTNCNWSDQMWLNNYGVLAVYVYIVPFLVVITFNFSRLLII